MTWKIASCVRGTWFSITGRRILALDCVCFTSFQTFDAKDLVDCFACSKERKERTTRHADFNHFALNFCSNCRDSNQNLLHSKSRQQFLVTRGSFSCYFLVTLGFNEVMWCWIHTSNCLHKELQLPFVSSGGGSTARVRRTVSGKGEGSLVVLGLSLSRCNVISLCESINSGIKK